VDDAVLQHLKKFLVVKIMVKLTILSVEFAVYSYCCFSAFKIVSYVVKMRGKIDDICIAVLQHLKKFQMSLKLGEKLTLFLVGFAVLQHLKKFQMSLKLLENKDFFWF